MEKGLSDKLSFLMLIASWWAVGVFAGPLIFIYMPLTWLLLLRKGFFEALFFGFLVTLIMSDSLEPSMLFAAQMKPLYLFFLVLVLISNRRRINVNLGIFVSFIPYFIVAVIAIMWSQTVSVAIQKTLSYVLLCIAVPSYAYYLLDNKPQLYRNLNYLAGFILFLSVLFYLLNPEIGGSHGGRMRGVFGNPNGLGLYLIVTFLFYQLSIWKNPKCLNRQEKWFFIGLIFVCTIYSGSRNALISILAFYLFSFTYKRFKYLGVIISVIIIPLINYVAFNAVDIIQALSLGELFRVESLVEGSGRLIAWKFAWLHIQDNFFLGRGISFDEYLMRSNAPYLSRLGHEGGVHNTYLIIWLNTGIIGLICFFSATLYLFIKAFRKDVLAIPILITVLFSISFEPWLSASLNPYTSVYLIVLTGLLFHKSEILNESKD